MIGLRSYLALAGLLALAGAFWWYGHTQYRAGVRDTVARFAAADKKGAENVQKTAAEALRSIGDDADAERLLESTGGLRD